MSCLPQLRERIFLLGDVEVQICGNKLPSSMQVLKVLFFNLRYLKLSLDEGASLAIKEVCVFWEKARIPTRAPHHCVKKLKTLHQEWRTLQKSASKPYNLGKEQNFLSMLKKLFDIAHQDAMNDIDEQAREFLSNQRKDERIGYIANIKTAYDVEEDVRLQTEAIEKKGSQKQKMRKLNTDEQVQLESGCSSQATSSQQSIGSEFNPEECGGSSQSEKRRGTIMIMTQKLAAVLDRCKVTNRNAVHLIIATAQALNCDVSSLVINTTSIRCSRNEFRGEKAKKIKKIFEGTELNSIVLHWDGKLMPNFLKHDTTERLPVVISDGKTEQLLGIPELENSKGSTQARAIYELLVDWDLCEKVKGLCCDITNSNLGMHNGAAVLLEQLLERDLVWFPCRHHIGELVLKGVFTEKIPGTSGPAVPLFKRFKESWKTIDKSNYEVGFDNEELKRVLAENVEKINAFIEEARRTKQPRDDYKEFLDLVQILIGTVPPERVKFRHPGAFHHARFMGKAIYSLKIQLFRKEFKLTADEKKVIPEVCLFIIVIYVQAWFTAPSAPQAPNHDLQLLKNIINYRLIDKKVSTAAFEKIKNHLWYLNPQTAAMAFFDEKLTIDIKRKMVSKLNVVDSLSHINSRKFQIGLDNHENFLDKEIDHFINSDSLRFFGRFCIDTEFLTIDPSMWPENVNFQKGLDIVRSFRVVNDTAERAVNLVQTYNNQITTDEDQKLYMLQVVAEYRKQFQDSTKSTVMMDFK